MSPKSRGRPPGRGRPKRAARSGPPRPKTPADLAIADAVHLVGESSRLSAEIAASTWLGQAWLEADPLERDPEHMLVLGVVGRAHNKPAAHRFAAVQALRLVAPADDHRLLDESIAMLGENFPPPLWATSEPPTPISAYIARDPWGSQEGLAIEFGGEEPHGLLAQVTYPGGTIVQTIGLIEPGVAERWDEIDRESEVPMPLVEHPIDEVLRRLAVALRSTASQWPKHDDDAYVDLRALAASRCASVVSDDEAAPEWEPMADADRASLIDEFIRKSGLPDDLVTRHVADLCVDYGDGYIADGVFAWSPAEVEIFLVDWLPRKAILDEKTIDAVPAVLRAWVAFALGRTSLESRWIDPAVGAVDEYAEAFLELSGDDSSWGPSKQILAGFLARGVDITDEDQLAAAIEKYNAEIDRQMRED